MKIVMTLLKSILIGILFLIGFGPYLILLTDFMWWMFSNHSTGIVVYDFEHASALVLWGITSFVMLCVALS